MSQHDIMQVFLRALRKWAPHIERMTYSTITIEAGHPGEFTVTASWAATRAGPAGSHHMSFNRQRVLGRTASLPPLQQRPTKKICRFSDDIIAEVLQVRKVA